MPQNAPNFTQPLGQGDYSVRQGDCLSSIAYNAGHAWRTIWNDAANAQLREKRGDPNVLLPGDLLTIPPLRLREVSRETEKKHKFRRKGVPETLRIVVRHWGDPLANQPYELIVDGRSQSGRTDGDGKLEQKIPPDAHDAILKVGSGDDQVEYHLDLGGIDPIDSVSGIQARLLNLGFYLGALDGELNEGTLQAIEEFCGAHDIASPAQDQVSDEFRQKLKEIHGF